MQPQDLERLFDTCYDDVHAYVSFRVSPHDDVALDLVQAVFEAVLTAPGRPRDDAAARSYLMAVARNKVADHFRKLRPESLDPDVVDVLDPRERADGRFAEVSLALRAIGPEPAALLEEKYLEGLSLRAMAASRGKSEKAVESALARARVAFQESLSRFESRTEPR